jgi:hypothetical protein
LFSSSRRTDLAGHEIAQFTSTGNWTRGEVYAGGRHLATYQTTSPMTWFNYSDWLGTERVRQPYPSGANETCTSLPFGDALNCVGGDPSPMHFTGKEHDSETNLESFGCPLPLVEHWPVHDAGLVRRATGHPLRGVSRSQSLNRYAYIRKPRPEFN